jgi:hypothetical protein
MKILLNDLWGKKMKFTGDNYDLYSIYYLSFPNIFHDVELF